MADISTYINPSNGDYVIQNGSILNNNSLLAEIYFCLATPLGTYIYDLTLGNKLLNLPTAPPGTKITQLLTNALSPLVKAGRIRNIRIRILIAVKQSYSAVINAVDATGQPVEFKWTKV